MTSWKNYISKWIFPIIAISGLLWVGTACSEEEPAPIEPDITADYPLVFFGDIQEVYADTSYVNREHQDTLYVNRISKNRIEVRFDSLGTFTCQVAGQAAGHSFLNPGNGTGVFTNIVNINGSYLRSTGAFTFILEGNFEDQSIYQISFSGNTF
jgi:hypothetical protein